MEITYIPDAETVFGDVLREIEATQSAFLDAVAEIPDNQEEAR